MRDEVKTSMGIYSTLVPFPQGNLGGAPGCNALLGSWGVFCACGAGGVRVTVGPRQETGGPVALARS
jgi:hypothetical protein